MNRAPLLVAALLAACAQDKPLAPEAPAAGKLTVEAALSPDPGSLDLSQVDSWNLTGLEVTLSHDVFDAVRLVANPPGSPVLLEIRHTRPNERSGTYCPPEPSDTKTRRPGQSVWFQPLRGRHRHPSDYYGFGRSH